MHNVGDDDDQARSLIESMLAKDKRLLGYLCAFVLVNRALAKLADMSPIISIDPIYDDAARFVMEETGLSYPQAIRMVGHMGSIAVRDDIAGKFMKYDRNMVI